MPEGDFLAKGQDIHYPGVVEQLQHENEKLREEVMNLKKIDLQVREIRKNITKNLSSPTFWFGCLVGMIFLNNIPTGKGGK